MLAGARDALRDVPGVAPIWQQDTYMLPTERTSFGFKDGISNPAIEGSGIPGTNPHEEPFKAGEFVLGYPNENGDLPPDAPARGARPQRQLRRLPQAPDPRGGLPPVRPRPAPGAEPRRSCWPPSSSVAGRAARRWCSPRSATTRSSGPIPARNNAFRYVADDDARGLKCPLGAHARRTYPRDSPIIGVARMHRIIRRSSSYGPMLPEGVLEDDGADRGILFFCLQANLARGFEFVKTQWINEGTFFGTPDEMDPLVGPNDGTGRFTVPQQPIRRRLTELPQFVVNRGGEYSSCPACGRCAGSPTSTPEPADPKHRHPQPRDGRPTCRPAEPCACGCREPFHAS